MRDNSFCIFFFFYCITVVDHEIIAKRSTDNRKPILPVNGKERERERCTSHERLGYIFEINVVHRLKRLVI